MWKLRIVPRVQIFLWLVYNNKILTRNNLAKRQHVPHMTCVFCAEAESCQHLFFDCVVSIELWRAIADISGVGKISNIENLATWWVSNKKHAVVNALHSAAMWGLWKIRNNLCFNRSVWYGMQKIWRQVALQLAAWEVLFLTDARTQVSAMVKKIEKLARDPPMLMWPDPG